MTTTRTIRFTALGIPQPGGSKRHIGNGVIIDANRKERQIELF